MTAVQHASATGEEGTVLIEAADLRLGYGRRTVLDDVRLEIRRGHCWFFVGPNGSGKTTLIRAILGLLPCRAGHVRTRVGRDRIAFVPQRCEFGATLPTTVREFVSLGLVGVPVRNDERKRLAWALDQVGLHGIQDEDYWSLSGGQRQRALVARALVRRPSLLLADEPTNGLDLFAQTTLLDSLAGLRRSEDLTLVVITHDLMLAARYATHVALFHSGRVIAGPVLTVFRSPTLQTVYKMPPEVCDRVVAAASLSPLETAHTG